jgi:hypothetical protein
LFGGLLFYSIAVSFDLYQRTMMDEAIDGGGGKGIVVVQDVSPISESAVGGYDDGTTFIPVRDAPRRRGKLSMRRRHPTMSHALQDGAM